MPARFGIFLRPCNGTCCELEYKHALSPARRTHRCHVHACMHDTHARDSVAQLESYLGESGEAPERRGGATHC
jgi:hypothetical protein